MLGSKVENKIKCLSQRHSVVPEVEPTFCNLSITSSVLYQQSNAAATFFIEVDIYQIYISLSDYTTNYQLDNE